MKHVELDVPQNLNHFLESLLKINTFPVTLNVRGKSIVVRERDELTMLVFGADLMWDILDDRHPGIT